MLIVCSLAIPAGVLAVILVNSQNTKADPAAGGLIGAAPKHALTGDMAPDFALPGLDGAMVKLSSFRGRPVVLTFFASWCGPCHDEMPVLQRLQHDDGTGVAVIGVNYQDASNDTRRFVADLHLTFPTLIEQATKNPVAHGYDVHEIPDTVFIDAAGVVRKRAWGPMSTHDLETAVAQLVRP